VVRIDRLSPQDDQRSRSIRLQALQEAAESFGSTFDTEVNFTQENWQRRLERSDAVTFVASEEGDDIGTVVGVADPEHPGEAALVAMWVAPETRGRRVGEALVQAVIDWARSEGYKAVRLAVADHNASAQRLYDRTGFVPTRTVDTFPPPRTHITQHERRLELRRHSG
jgi:ribosomal protein S18 acetylase RimI-like enzyme